VSESLRVDKWLWHARFFKTRTLAAKVVSDGAVRLNSTRISKSSATVKPDDTLTFPQGSRIRVVRIVALGTRRGPAPEAQALYEDLTPPAPVSAEAENAPGFDGKGRPTKKDRRAWESKRGVTS
jgi:ribosome-associated heat shock protein Hsp15